MKCAKCGHDMETIIHSGVELDMCPKCSGLWFDEGEYEKMLKVSDIEKLKNTSGDRSADDLKKAPCPRCHTDSFMVQVLSVNPSIHMDKCSKCNGIWLDGGEFEKLHLDEVMDKLEKLFDF